MDIDLSPFQEGYFVTSKTFNQVKSHMENFSSERCLQRIISCYRAGERNPRHFVTSSCDATLNTRTCLTHLFFPVWILLALIPEEKERSLTIENVVVAQNQLHRHSNDPQIPSEMIDDICSLVGEGSLTVRKLTVVCNSNKLCNINELQEELAGLGNITIESRKVKVIIQSVGSIDTFLEELDAATVGVDEVRLMLGDDNNGRKITLNEADMDKISTRLEDDDLNAEVPVLEGIYDSPHTMLGDVFSTEGLSITYHNMSADRILVAILGYGCSSTTGMTAGNFEPNTFHNRIIDKKNFATDRAPVHYHRHTSSSLLIDYYTKEAKFVICQTTYCNGVIANGATSKAIKWLREEWEETWKGRPYDNLIVLIPYGGQYMEDEMIQIHEATNEGIIIVCAAGGMGGRVVFPAALGTVLSVGVSNSGPKGREVDIHVSEESLTQTFPFSRFSTLQQKGLSIDCGVAAAKITGLLALLLSRINSILNSNLTDPLHQGTAGAIKNIPHYLHTCVIRELLVNEGNGSHHPQLGYGDGEEILDSLLRLDESSLLEQLAGVLLKDNELQVSNTANINEEAEANEERRRRLFHNLDGSGISVAVLDIDTEEDEQVERGDYETSFKPFNPTGNLSQHGEQCATIVHAVSPNASILCANNVEDDLSLGFYDCTRRSPSIDVISYSISSLFFDLNMCTAVNEAVVAGKIIVFAAGNTGQKHRNTIGYPGRIGNILVVGGRDPHYNRIGFSSVGREMDFLAEGETGDLRGTSYAAPVVAGYIALLLQFIKENMNTDEDRIRAWSKNSQDEYEWQDIPAFDAAHNVYAMRTLLKLLIPKPQDHSDTEGFGCLVFSKLFPRYKMPNSHELVTGSVKTKIRNTLQCFYKHQ